MCLSERAAKLELSERVTNWKLSERGDRLKLSEMCDKLESIFKLYILLCDFQALPVGTRPRNARPRPRNAQILTLAPNQPIYIEAPEGYELFLGIRTETKLN
jgi:hypothetical protein